MVRHALARDPEAIRRLGVRLSCIPRFVRTLNRRQGSPLPDGQLPDVQQDVIRDLWSKLGEYRGAATIETWSFTFCDFGVRNAARRSRREQSRLVSLDREGAPTLEALEPRLRRVDRIDEIETCLSHLDQVDAELLRARYLDELEFGEIAERTDMPVNTVKTRFYRALERLRGRMQQKSGGKN